MPSSITFLKNRVTWIVDMTYLSTRDVAAIAICAALWGILNGLFAPIFFSIFHVPFFCDIVGFSVLILAAWWIRKLGAITIIGAAATLINFALAPNPYHFLGFTAASIFFVLTTALSGYDRSFSKKKYMAAIMMAISVLSAALAGYIIGTFFMAGPALAQIGGALGWAGLHAAGGTIGGAIGTSLVAGLDKRKITVNNHGYGRNYNGVG
jgi:hypothetical protein